MSPEQYVQERAAASGSSFYYAFLFLPKPRRIDVTRLTLGQQVDELSFRIVLDAPAS